MAFDVGQRVTSRFTGAGTVLGELTKETDGSTVTVYQEVEFDNPTLGVKRWEVRKLNPLD